MVEAQAEIIRDMVSTPLLKSAFCSTCSSSLEENKKQAFRAHHITMGRRPTTVRNVSFPNKPHMSLKSDTKIIETKSACDSHSYLKEYMHNSRVHKSPAVGKTRKLRTDTMVKCSQLYRCNTTEEKAMRPVHLRGLPAQNPQTRRFDNRTGVNLSYNKASVLGPRPVLPGNAIRSREKGDLIYDGPFHLLKEVKPGIVQQVQQVEESDGTGSKGCVTLLSFTPSHGKPHSDFGLVQTTYRHIAIDKNENYARGKSRQRGNSHTKKVLIGPRFPIQ